MAGRYPIVYVRGFAGSTRGIDSAVEDPFYGFSQGSTHVRVGGSGDPIFYQFESPLVRLITEMGYRLLVDGSQEAYLDAAEPGSVPAESIWIHRFYDRSSSTWERSEEGPEADAAWDEANAGRQDLSRRQVFALEAAADDLLRYVEAVRLKTGAEKVHLVAHSMGGLICRSMIQRSVPDRGAAGGAGHTRAADIVDRLFTYGTPHGGITFDLGLGLLERVRDEFGLAGADIFGPERMYEYLTPRATRDRRPPPGWDARDNPDPENFPPTRIFCVVGTNAGDYGAAMGLSAKAVGVRSDGLVQIENAALHGANRAFVHRSHSGRYGLVNSEEGYQNLIRFLFGDVRVAADMVGLHLPDRERLTWQAEAQVAIRGLPVLLHDQVAAHHSPIRIELRPGEDPADRAVPLVTTYLWTARALAHRPMRYTLHVRLLSLQEHDGVFFWRDHVEQTTDFDDTLVVDVEQRDGGLAAWARWASEITVPLRDYQPSGEQIGDTDPRDHSWLGRVPFPPGGKFLGEEAAVTLQIRPAD